MSAAANSWIVEATDANFEQLVIERSRVLPVVVDFWAEWCQPCRLLAPLLEKLTNELAGQFVLVKVNVDQAPSAASAFGVQSIPAVYGLRDGQLVDYFVGVLPEPQLRTWLERLLPTAAEGALREAAGLAASDPVAAEGKYRQAIELDPKLAAAKIGLAGLLLTQGRADDVRQLVAELEARGFLEPEAERVKSQLEVQAKGQQLGSLDEVRAAADANPDDFSARLKLAEALAAAGQHEAALAEALRLVQQDRKGVGEQARQFMLNVFNLLPADSELATTYRRKLSLALY